MSDRDDPERYGPVEFHRYCRDCGGRIGVRNSGNWFASRGCGDWRCPGYIPNDEDEDGSAAPVRPQTTESETK